MESNMKENLFFIVLFLLFVGTVFTFINEREKVLNELPVKKKPSWNKRKPAYYVMVNHER